jgi:hypothetical protein
VSGTCEPPGPSRKIAGRASAGKRERTSMRGA